MNEILKGTKDRDVNDFYATNPKCVVDILDLLYKDTIDLTILEPCAGNGHIVEAIKENFDYNEITTNDLIQRDYPLDSVCDFLETAHCFGKFDLVITNPPFKIAKEFIEKSLECVNDDGLVVMFARLQLLESEKRKELMENHLAGVFVYSNRVQCAKGGDEKEFNKSSSMAFAWFVFVKNKKKDTIVRWI